ncbi:MAG: Ig domain-containing protein [Myxococcota bacterium]
MKRAIAAAIALSFAACGGSSDAPSTAPARKNAQTSAASKENEAPEIQSAEIVPNPAGAADALGVEVHVRDAEHDRLTTSVEWFKNGVLVPELRESVVEAGTFTRGDRVYAVVHVSDPTHEVTRQTAALSIGNSAPRLHAVMVTPLQPTATDLIEAQPNADDADGDSVEVSYRWFKNGVLIAGATSNRLPAGSVRRGDKLGVQASASDGSDTSPWVASTEVLVANAKPTITTQPGYEMGASGVYSYQIGAKDPDGDDPLKFELVEGPPGMAIDEASGVLTWTVPQDAKGNNPIEIAVSDSFGGRATQHWALSVDWNQAPASPAATASEKTGTKKAAAAPDSDEEAPAKAAAPKAKAAPAVKETPAKAKRLAAKPADESDNEPEQDQGEPAGEEPY